MASSYEEELAALKLKWRKIRSFKAFLDKYPRASADDVVNAAITADLGCVYDSACVYLGTASDHTTCSKLPIADKRNPLNIIVTYAPPQARFFFCRASTLDGFRKSVDEMYERICAVIDTRGGYTLFCPSYAKGEQGLIVALHLDERVYGEYFTEEAGKLDGIRSYAVYGGHSRSEETRDVIDEDMRRFIFDDI